MDPVTHTLIAATVLLAIIDPVSIVIIGGLALAAMGVYGKKKTTKANGAAKRRIRFTADCEEWEIPDLWVPGAEEEWQDQLDALLEEHPLDELQGEVPQPPDLVDRIEAHLVASTYEQLDPQLPAECTEPIVEVEMPDGSIVIYTFRALQTIVPDSDDYWPESEAVLMLYDHIFQAQSDALERFIETGERAESLMFPVELLPEDQ